MILGGLAGNLRGTPDVTTDLDICYDRSRENLQRLAAALQELGAHLRGAREDVSPAFPIDAQSLALGDTFTFTTDAGDLDVLATPSGTGGYGDLSADATAFEVAHDLVIDVASIQDLIRMKRASGRTKDRLLESLGALLEESEAFEGRAGDA